MKKLNFPVGYYDFHKEKIMNFQLNRWYSLGYTDFEETKEVAKRIHKFEDWKPEMIQLAQKSLNENRFISAAFYFRAAEFFTLPYDPDKDKLYDKFIDLFYNAAFKDEPLERFHIPYRDTLLPAIRIKPQEEENKGTIVIHGGFDSVIEEFYSMATYFADLGYDVIMFEGPGQGAALKKYNLPLTYKWEKPAKAVLDYFRLDNVTWLGISMGGWLCFRAAAFEPRIKRVIALSVAFDYMQIPNTVVQLIAKLFLKFPSLLNYSADLKMKMSYQNKWGINNLMYITKTKKAIEGSNYMLKFNEKNLHSENVKSDVLILSGAEDHFIPLKMHYKQIAALKNAKSIEDHVFTRKDQAQNHCQIGNIGLALDIMSNWINKKS
ncbi:alpha/beta fold hydrolase [Methanobacterium sp. ACI-7]|uniref:alpha/beta fold hydrolase n=1 Tax=unclassified Methanobacterium TaxID=2627676 RepID=UPI0039C3E91D